MTSFVADFGI